MCEMLYIRVCVFVNVCVYLYIHTNKLTHTHIWAKKLILAPNKCFKRKEIFAEKFVEKKFQLKINFGTKIFRPNKYAKKNVFDHKTFSKENKFFEHFRIKNNVSMLFFQKNWEIKNLKFFWTKENFNPKEL
jgi:hypothetical protein